MLRQVLGGHLPHAAPYQMKRPIFVVEDKIRTTSKAESPYTTTVHKHAHEALVCTDVIYRDLSRCKSDAHNINSGGLCQRRNCTGLRNLGLCVWQGLEPRQGEFVDTCSTRCEVANQWELEIATHWERIFHSCRAPWLLDTRTLFRYVAGCKIEVAVNPASN